MEPNECYRTLLCNGGKLAEWALQEALERERHSLQEGWRARFWARGEKGKPLSSYGFWTINLDLAHVFMNCPELKTIDSIAKIKSAGVTRMLSFDHYKLHKDINRGVGINMLLQHKNSFCAFVDIEENKTIQLPYQSNTMYLLNVQVAHTVFNFEEDRYLFTIEFEDTLRLLPYRGLVKLLSKESII